MSDKTGNVKLGAAVVGGYVLGRTKKGMLALRLAMYLSGDQGGPANRVIGSARHGVAQIAQSDEARQIVDQVKGPLMEALQRAALAAVTTRVSGVADRLNEHTAHLNELASGTVDTATDTVEGTVGDVGDTVQDTGEKATGKLRGLLHRKDKDKDSAEQDEPEQEPDEAAKVAQDDADETEEESEAEEPAEAEAEDEGEESETAEAEEPEPEPEPEPERKQRPTGAATRRPQRRPVSAGTGGGNG